MPSIFFIHKTNNCRVARALSPADKPASSDSSVRGQVGPHGPDGGSGAFPGNERFANGRPPAANPVETREQTVVALVLVSSLTSGASKRHLTGLGKRHPRLQLY